MAPVQRTEGVHAFLVEDGLAAKVEPTEVTRALRRAVMTRVQGVLGARKSLPVFFTGHQRDGSPARTERKPHLTFAWDPERARLLIIAPHVIGQRSATGPEIRHLRNLETALVAFRELRAGSAGCLTLRPVSIDFELDHLFAASRTWESVTTYEVTRHAKRMTAAEALCCDIRKECRRRGLPEPIVTAREPRGVPGVGLVGGAYLRFEVAVKGPIALGKNRHFGGGLFKRK
jgi:CRISPR-associated protein Csb2